MPPEPQSFIITVPIDGASHKARLVGHILTEVHPLHAYSQGLIVTAIASVGTYAVTDLADATDSRRRSGLMISHAPAASPIIDPNKPDAPPRTGGLWRVWTFARMEVFDIRVSVEDEHQPLYLGTNGKIVRKPPEGGEAVVIGKIIPGLREHKDGGTIGMWLIDVGGK